MTIVILQPGYIPWLGFFEQMWRSDVFVFYDDVQFDKNGWRNRNRIKSLNGPLWLTVPVAVHLGDKILNVRIDNKQDWGKRHIKSLETYYKKAPFFEQYFPVFRDVLSKKWDFLLDLDVEIIRLINGMLGMEKKIMFSSELGVREGGKIGRLIDICKFFGADMFYEGGAGKNYINDEEFAREGIKVKYQNYQPQSYSQLYEEFVPHLSVVDLLFNEGPKSLEIIINGGR